jgi:hypothetical protein
MEAISFRVAGNWPGGISKRTAKMTGRVLAQAPDAVLGGFVAFHNDLIEHARARST